MLFILLGVPAVLWSLAQQLATSADWSSRPDLLAMLVRPDDGTVLMALLLVIGIVVWLVLALSILAELVAVLGSRPSRRIDLPGFRLGRTVAAALITTIVGAGPAMAAAPAAMVVPVSTVIEEPRQVPDVGPVHLVAPRDTLWQIAETALGDPLRWREIFDLNVGRPQADGSTLTEASTLTVGWELRLPTDARDAVRVEPGDTLSALATDHLGDPGRAPELFEVNRGVDQAGGPGLVDPDLLRPGWLLTLPRGLDTVEPPQAEVVPPPAPPVEPRPATPVTPSTPAPTSLPTSSLDQADQTDQEPDKDVVAPAAIAAVSAIVLGGLATALRVRRRRQQRFRPARHRIAVPPDTAGRVEWLTSQAPVDLTSAFLDAALRSLTLQEWDDATPSLRYVVLDRGQATLTLAEPAAPPAPFLGLDVDAWELDAEAELPLPVNEAGGYCAPFPVLVSVATDGERTLLVDLEQDVVTRVTGDGDRGAALMRHVVAELATARWAEDVEVLIVGLGDELVALDPDRLRTVETLGHALDEVELCSSANRDLVARMGVGSVRDGRLRGVAADSWLPLVVIAAVDPAESDRRRLQSLAPSGVVVVVADDADYGVELYIDTDGRLGAPHLDDGPWRAADLSESIGAQLASVLGATGDPSEPVRPAPESEPWAEGMDEDGALPDLPPLPVDRPTDPDESPPEVDAEAVRRLRIVDHQDPRLDDDLAAWNAEDSHPLVPMIAVLGGPAVRAPGPPPQARPSWFVEVLVYLSLHPAGVTAEKALTDLWPDGRRVNAATVRHAFYGARRWAGRGWGGDAAAAFVSDMQTDSTYRLRGHLLDWDLFRRLRKRGQARYAAGHSGAVKDYEAALALIRGPVLSGLRPGGYAWLNNHDQRHDLQIPGYIVDAAHELVDIALAAGDTTRARRAAERARAVDVDVAFDQPLTDLMRIAHAEDNRAELELHAALLLDARGFEVPEELAPESFAVLNALLPAGPRRARP
ncbi:LysM peptidoglycan-binding domain-containing protein [Pseudonocardia abyssalis]|uniref:LysM peptidoglycan-binding domain-containing protein n=3 Tax=Pseudonocardia abyssalis TaxID=2792008 RepID=A0ABS6URR4_9PSEU|nr:LysM peptidoglycan-binding domain-containing protein [Pseudonocardia abyssalis]MBW0134948.1 LysM peptidoglycan-binding domain-containing protein [Pseudonocardia abyssalis]